MSGPYWSQWDTSDLYNWMSGEDEDDSATLPRAPRVVVECDCGRCMECFGMSWTEFM